MEKELIPQLRFSEFSKNWEIKDIKNIAKVVGGGTPSTTEKEYWNGNINWFTPTEIKFDIVSESKRKITDLGLKKSSATLLPKGAILLTTRATIGEMAIAQEECTTNQGFQSLVVNKNNSNQFVFDLIKVHRKELYKRANGSTFKEISKKEVEKIKVLIPKLPEQQKIAAFLTDVDEKITKLTKKKNLLEEYKKGIMQKIFNQELRFKDDEGNDFPEWEEKKLNEIGEFKNGINKSKNDFGKGYPFVNLMDVFGKSTVSNQDLGLVNANIKELQFYNLKKGDILFIRSSVKREGVGQTSLLLYDLDKTVYSGFLIRFRFKFEIDLYFKKYCFNTSSFRNRLLAKSTTSANTNINQESLSTLFISIPSSIAEQTKIANFLSDIDLKIEALNTKIENSKTFKKGLLQKMFV